MFLRIEFFLLCLALPTVIIVFKLAPFMFVFLWGAALYCLWRLWRMGKPDWRKEWNWAAVTWVNMRPVLGRWLVCSVFMLVFTWAYAPDRLFGIFERAPHIIPFLLALYPLLSALPQEFIFCSFFFKRYAPFFKSQKAMIMASALVFAYAHVLFINWIAPLFSFVAGLIFARTYAQHKSLALVTIEHGLYGNVLFLVGLGWYFYGGAVQP